MTTPKKQRVTLTLSEFQIQGETKRKRVNVGRIHQYEDGGTAIVLDAALCATIAAKAQAALNNGEDNIWLSIFEDKPESQGFNKKKERQKLNKKSVELWIKKNKLKRVAKQRKAATKCLFVAISYIQKNNNLIKLKGLNEAKI